MKFKNQSLIFLIIISAFLVFSCQHLLPEDLAGSSATTPIFSVTPCSPDSVYFANEIMPIISSNCTMSGCHDNISHKEGVNLTSYNNIMRYVSPGNPSNSKLYKVVVRTDNERMPPPPMPALTQVQKEKINKWINQGAKNNSCAAACDSAVFTYSGAIKSTIQNKCVGCHNPASLGGSIDLSTYAGVKTVALNGKLFGSIAQVTGFSAMPKNSAKLSDCEIRQIQKWINAGAINN
jgi:uncharacterized membrane protein